MSDNPADSLQLELELEAAKDKLHTAIHDVMRRGHDDDECAAVLDAVWPALEAARADERDRLEAENQQLRDEAEQLQRQVRTAEQWMGALPHIKPARRGGV